MADELKAKGNAAFASRDFETAIKHFTEAIELNGSNHVLYSNRSASQASLQKWDAALADAEKCVELKPDWAKGYSRLGSAHYGLGNFQAAIDAYKKGLEMDGSNEQLKSGLRDAESAMSGGGPGSGGLAGLFGPKFISALAMNPETRPFLSDPDFMNKLKLAGSNPQMMFMFAQQDAKFSKALEVGLGLSLGGMGGAGDMGQDEEASSSDRHGTGGASTGAGAGAGAGSAAAQAKPAQPPPPAPEPDSGLGEEEKLERESKAKALKEKEAGNAAYKKRDFDTAIQHYDAAIELYDKDISFVTNRAAVHFELGDYEAAIADCERAVERGRELRSDFKMIAKAMTRHGNCLVKQGKLAEAVDIFNKALTEHRNPETLKVLRATEKALQEQKEDAYVDVSLAEAEKDKGNEAFKGADYPKAVAHYTEALKRGPPRVWKDAYKVFSNRSACYTKLGALPEGEKDADQCIELAPDFPKGYLRKGNILLMMRDIDKALEAFESGLQHDKDNAELKDGVLRCQYQLSRFLNGSATDEEVKERQARSMQNPEIQNIMSDPVMQQVLKECTENPSSVSHHFKDPMVGAKLKKLIMAGIIRMA